MSPEKKVGLEQIAESIEEIKKTLRLMLVLIGIGAVFGIIWFLYWLSNRL